MKWPVAAVPKVLVTLCIGGGMGIAMCVARDAGQDWKQVA